VLVCPSYREGFAHLLPLDMAEVLVPLADIRHHALKWSTGQA
jgi:hypothetical protein